MAVALHNIGNYIGLIFNKELLIKFNLETCVGLIIKYTSKTLNVLAIDG